MANFVLLQGAQHGGWCWQRATKALQQFDAQRVAAVPRTFARSTQPALATIAPSRLRARDLQF